MTEWFKHKLDSYKRSSIRKQRTYNTPQYKRMKRLHRLAMLISIYNIDYNKNKQ